MSTIQTVLGMVGCELAPLIGIGMEHASTLAQAVIIDKEVQYVVGEKRIMPSDACTAFHIIDKIRKPKPDPWLSGKSKGTMHLDFYMRFIYFDTSCKDVDHALKAISAFDRDYGKDGVSARLSFESIELNTGNVIKSIWPNSMKKIQGSQMKANAFILSYKATIRNCNIC